MITNLPEEELVQIGSRHRAQYLLQQADYTVGLAKGETGLKDFVSREKMEEIIQTVKSVQKALTDKELAKAESKDATLQQTQAIREAKVWRRKLAKIARNATLTNRDIPDQLIQVGRGGDSVPGLINALSTQTELARRQEKPLAEYGLTQFFLEQGGKILERLRGMDQTQELARLKNLPEKTREFYKQKGLLYSGLKLLNGAGQALFAADLNRAAKFNLNVLYRNIGRGRGAAGRAASARAATKPAG